MTYFLWGIVILEFVLSYKKTTLPTIKLNDKETVFDWLSINDPS